MAAVLLAAPQAPALASALASALAPAHAATSTPAIAKFPENFLFGVSMSGFQSEGSFPDGNWTRYARNHEPYGNSVDFGNRYPGDLQLARDLGVNVFRTSLEWARIESRRGVRDATELAYYDDLVRRIKAAGMRPMLTLDHWAHPGWVADQGGWTNPSTSSDRLRHARFMVERYRGQGAACRTCPSTSWRTGCRPTTATRVSTDTRAQTTSATTSTGCSAPSVRA
jgi:beta-glucosidase